MDLEKVIKNAYVDWLLNCADELHEADRAVLPFLDINAQKSNWLRTARKSSWRCVRDVAEQAGISHTTWLTLEKCEETGDITLKRLASAAAAIDCELIYAIRPKSRKPFSIGIWETLLKKARPKFEERFSSPIYQTRSMTSWTTPVIRSIVRDLMRSPSFRRTQGWSRQHHITDIPRLRWR